MGGGSKPPYSVRDQIRDEAARQKVSRIHIARRKGGLAVVVLTAGRRPRIGVRATIDGPSEVLCDQPPLATGATCWVETTARVTVIRREKRCSQSDA